MSHQSDQPNPLAVLEEIFSQQGAFSRRVRQLKEGKHPSLLDVTVEQQAEWSRTYILAAHAELSEMLDTVPSWKPHRRSLTEQVFDRDAYLEEGVDVFNYLLAALGVHKVTPEQFYEVWRGKLDVLHQRMYQEIERPLIPGEPAVMLDIDGVLADWRRGYMEFLFTEQPALLQGSPYQDDSAHYAIDQQLGIAPDLYHAFKEAFHREGGLRRLPRFGFAKELIRVAQKLGRIVVVTSRPGEDRKVYRDTLYWLRNLFGEVPFTLHFTEDKATWLARTGVKLMAAVEDEPRTAKRLMGQFPDTIIYVPEYLYNDSLGHHPVPRNMVRQPLNLLVDHLEALSFRDPEAEVAQ